MEEKYIIKLYLNDSHCINMETSNKDLILKNIQDKNIEWLELPEDIFVINSGEKVFIQTKNITLISIKKEV